MSIEQIKARSAEEDDSCGEVCSVEACQTAKDRIALLAAVDAVLALHHQQLGGTVTLRTALEELVTQWELRGFPSKATELRAILAAHPDTTERDEVDERDELLELAGIAHKVQSPPYPIPVNLWPMQIAMAAQAAGYVKAAK